MVQACSHRTACHQQLNIQKHEIHSICTDEGYKSEEQRRRQGQRSTHEEHLIHLMHERDEMRNDAKKNILKLQEDNGQNYDKKRKKSASIQGWRLRCNSANPVWDWPQAATKILQPLRSGESQVEGLL
ncbi:hypothetical protein AVEN_232416-1 [Araneus ventricosus]|uniref:Uncharacterized protein n=1 Tax=Araneus ventricosus TaxID=182803 RepID=A0A4Y2P935_ARAVE|nr:hypothetical protein AVEN_232416-1 [Araneus ventricosus]